MSDEAPEPDQTGHQLQKTYQSRGIQQVSLDDYLAQKQKKGKKKFQLPSQLKIILYTPLILIFCCGILLIPYFCYQVLTGSPPAEDEKDNKKSALPARAAIAHALTLPMAVTRDAAAPD